MVVSWPEDLWAEAASHLAMLERRRQRTEEARRLERLARECLDAGTGRPEVSRRVENSESLYPRDNLAREIVPVVWEETQIRALSSEELYLPRPAHRFLERCKAVRRNR